MNSARTRTIPRYVPNNNSAESIFAVRSDRGSQYLLSFLQFKAKVSVGGVVGVDEGAMAATLGVSEPSWAELDMFLTQDVGRTIIYEVIIHGEI